MNIGRWLVVIIVAAGPAAPRAAQQEDLRPIFNGRDLTGWVNVNCAPETWSVREGMIHSTGKPICELRTARMYENFVLELEYQQLEPGGNAGVFIWGDALTAPGQPFVRAIEVQVLDGRNTPNYTSHGDVFPIHGATMTPDRPHPNGGSRSLPRERRAKPAGEWNHYRITARDGTLSLAVNGAEVSGGYDISPRKGYIHLESEGGVVLWRNLRLKELPPHPALPPDQVARQDEGFVSLYTGTDFRGWQHTAGHTPHWASKDWIIASDGKAQGEAQALWTEQAIGDAVVIADFRWISGAGADAPLPIRLAGVELPADSRGLLARALAAKPVRGSEPPWHRATLTKAQGRLTLDVNGAVIVKEAALEGLAGGHRLGLAQRAGAALEFANVFVRQLPPSSRPADIAFDVRLIDPGVSESVAVADFNRDGRLDLLSAEYWYEAPSWRKHKIRDIPFNGSYIDNFSDLPIDVDADGYPDIVQIAYFARRIVWLRNPGRKAGPWVETEIDAVGPTEFAFLVDLNNDGQPREILPQFTGAAKAPLTWYELEDGKWAKRVVSSRSYGHGIGAGDVNGDARNDIVTPDGWLEAPTDVRAPGEWTFHATDWARAAGAPEPSPPAPGGAAQPSPPERPAEYGFMYVLDVNKDGRRDILTTMAHSYGVLWFEQLPDGKWVRRMIDATWANAHASAMADLNGDGQPDLIAARRYFGRSGNDPAEREPMGIYWYQFRPGPKGSVEWIRHIVDYGGRAGGGLQMSVEDLDADGDRDIIAAGKTGLFVAENQTKPSVRRR